MEISSKRFLVSGASDGIGKGISLKLAQHGANILLLGRNSERLESVKAECLKAGAESVEVFVCDLTKLDDIKKVVAGIKDKNLDGLVNCAGVWQKLSDLHDISDEEILNVIQTNLYGLIMLTKYLLPLLLAAQEGVLINISSRSGHTAQKGQSVYTASKFGVRGFTEVLREDLKESNVRVAGVYQGGTNTKMFEKAGEDWPEERYKKFIPVEKLANIVVSMILDSDTVWLPEVRVESK